MPRCFGPIAWFVVLVAAWCGTAVADPLPRGFTPDRTNGSGKPSTSGGVTTLHINYGECSNKKYDDNRGESDCTNGNVRSSMSYAPDVRIGETMEYRFDVQLDSTFAYTGYYNDHAWGFFPNGWDSRLRIASWEGEYLHNFIYLLKADVRNGLNFVARTCQSSEHFGEWVSFSMKVRWSRDKKGWIKVTCDDRIIYADEGIATDQAPHCYITNVCEPGIVKHTPTVHFTLGPVMAGFGYEWKKYGKPSPYTEIQRGGITVRLRNVEVIKGAELYDEAEKALVVKLQQRLNEIGCDVGTPDGAVGPRTRDVAATCRKFPDGVLPAKLTVATLRSFVDAYQAEEATGFATAAPKLAAPGVEMTLSDIQSLKRGHDIAVRSLLRVSATGIPGPIDLGIAGEYDYQLANFRSLRLELQVELKDAQTEAVRRCDATVERSKLGGIKKEVIVTRVGIDLVREGDGFAYSGADCVLAALPAGDRAKLNFVLEHFRDLAITMIAENQAAELHHDGLQAFMLRVAQGEVTVVK